MQPPVRMSASLREAFGRTLLLPLEPTGSRTKVRIGTGGGCPTPFMQNPSEIRRTCKRGRRALGAHTQRLHSLAFRRRFVAEGLLRRYRHVAGYLARDGELDLAPLIEQLYESAKSWYLPVLRAHPRRKMWFVRHPHQGPLIPNRFGIPEPPLKYAQIRLPWALDLILVPLVAFDAQCNRLGMGGGFYDRTLAFLRYRRRWHRPLLVGVAHECQKVPALPLQAWDVPLDMVITEARTYRRDRQDPRA